MKDYYKILEISPTANAQEIKKAYHELALKYHPDKNRSNERPEHTFKELVEAYETLSNNERRQAYDYRCRYPPGLSAKSSAQQKDRPNEKSDQEKKIHTAFAKVYFINRSKDFILLRWKYNDSDWQVKNSPVGQTALGDLKFCVDNDKFVHIGEVPCKLILDLHLIFFNSMSGKEIAYEITNTSAINATDRIILAYTQNDLKQCIEGTEGNFSFHKNTLNKEETELLTNFFYYEHRLNKGISILIAGMLLSVAVCLWLAFKFDDCFICYFVTCIMVLFVFAAISAGFSNKITDNSKPDPSNTARYAERIKTQKLMKAFGRITRIALLDKKQPHFINISIFLEVERRIMKFSIPNSDHLQMGWNTNDVIYIEYFSDSYLIKIIKYDDTYLKHSNIKLK